jgi:branched-chain amino acid transport system permease protein
VLGVLTQGALFAIFAAGWDVMAGYVGLISFGQAAFVGAAAYSAAYLSPALPAAGVIAAGAVAAMAVAAVMGAPTLRLRGIYLGVVTFAFPLILEQLMYVFQTFGGGEQGRAVGVSASPLQLYYAAVILMAVSLALISVAVRSRLGLVFRALREDETAAAAAGNNVVAYRMAAFLISAAFTGAAGAVYGMYLGYAFPDLFDVGLSVQILTMGVIGGLGSIGGPALGGFALAVLNQFLVATGAFQDLIYAALLVVIVLLAPRGILGGVRSALDRLRAR